MSTDPYDRVPYGSRPLPDAHPDRLWVAGRLFGLAPPDPAGARILDLGCGAGLHLATIAARLPGARCVGLDRAADAVADARRTAERLGAGNVTFVEGDLGDPTALDDPSLPEAYDYIVAHGVYSWVEAPTRDALLALCAARLAPTGLAYVSYNVRPGWHLRGMLAEMARFHAAGFDTPERQVAQARALLGFLAEAVPERDPYGAWLRREARLVDDQPDAWVYHDLLAEPNDAVLVSDFVVHAERHGLAYLGDADVAAMLPDRLPEAVRQALDTVGPDALRVEQYLDFVLCRNFRRSVLCRPELPVDRRLQWQRLEALTLRAPLVLEDPDASGGALFRTRSGENADHGGAAAGRRARVLGERDPGAVPFDEVAERALAAAGSGDAAADRAFLGRNLLACFARAS
ncbi:MAG: class I SAM-dependent methyltransferase [Myxococcota bacterium]